MFRNGFSGFMAHMPPVTKNLIIINVIVWAVEAIFPKFGNTIINVLGLHYVGTPHFNPVQIITYMFVHAIKMPGQDTIIIFHLLFNMFSLWMFGSILERVWGSRRYFAFYFICGIGAGIVQEIVWAFTFHNLAENVVTIGASGAVYGLFLGFACVFPNQPLYLFFIPIPIKAKYMMIGYGLIEFFLGFNGHDTIAHFAHLGGMLFGLILILYWRKKGTLRGSSFY